MSPGEEPGVERTQDTSADNFLRMQCQECSSTRSRSQGRDFAFATGCPAGKCYRDAELTHDYRNKAGLNDWIYEQEHPEEKKE